MRKFKIRVNHSLGFFSIYEIEAEHYWDAVIIAEKKFIDDFCGGNNQTTFRGVTEKHYLESFVFNKYGQQ